MGRLRRNVFFPVHHGAVSRWLSSPSFSYQWLQFTEELRRRFLLTSREPRQSRGVLSADADGGLERGRTGG